MLIVIVVRGGGIVARFILPLGDAVTYIPLFDYLEHGACKKCETFEGGTNVQDRNDFFER